MELYVATRKGLFVVKEGRIAGAPQFPGDPVSAVLANGEDLYAALNLGHFGVKLRRSSNGGETWEEIAAPLYPPQPAGEEKTPWKLVQVWCLEAAAGSLWAGTIPGGLFRSADRGATWTLVETLWNRPERAEWFGGGYDHPGIHSVCIDPRDPRHVTVGISCGGVWRTRDGGASWSLAAKGMRAEYMPPDRGDDQNVQDPHRVVQCRDNPDVLWSQHHNGIFRSSDAAASWHEVQGSPVSKFGFAVAAHPHDPDTAWFVPAVKDERRIPVDAALCAMRTRDGGRSFQALRRGLPQEHAYDLVYRHALAVDADGNRLAMGSTTGGLWLSDDQGDSWHCVSAHLPPIYAVRFA
jgi:photosystem II stability/assembly factor-like uncharacterized protein